MNWKNIIESYPNASQKMFEWIAENRKGFEAINTKVEVERNGRVEYLYLPHGHRWLYDFFTHCGYEYNLLCDSFGNYWAFDLFARERGHSYSCFPYETRNRSDAEFEMFSFAFKFLENKL